MRVSVSLPIYAQVSFTCREIMIIIMIYDYFSTIVSVLDYVVCGFYNMLSIRKVLPRTRHSTMTPGSQVYFLFN